MFRQSKLIRFALAIFATLAFSNFGLAQPQTGRTSTTPPPSKLSIPNHRAKASSKPQAETTSPTGNALSKDSLLPRLAAEFEPQRAIVLSVCDVQPHNRNVLQQIVKKTRGYADLLILYNNDQQLKNTLDFLSSNGDGENVPLDHVSFYKLELDTVWLRDFGPQIAEDKNGARSIDFYYYGVRPFDDSFPERWALKTSGTVTKVAWTIQGGNLLTNGQGLGITTNKIFEDNKVSFGSNSTYLRANDEGRGLLLRELKQQCNLQNLVVLEPLRNESTKHVDMFAAFLASDQVLVAQLDARSDPTNAKVLDWNARKLAATKFNGKPLKVHRIKIPVREGAAWSTYTNAIFTERLVLMPTTKSDPSSLVASAKATFERLLPSHHIATIDITSMKKLQGSLHCMSLNLPAFAPLPPGVINVRQAKAIASQIKSSGSDSVPIAPKFSIDKQLRRIFKSSSSDYLVDAYAVALSGDVISLLRANDKKVIRVKTTGVCDSDRYWIQRNAKKIQTNGANVYRWVLSKP